MIGKFAAKRRDGKSDFGELIVYIGDAEKSGGAVWAGNLLELSRTENVAEQMASTGAMNGRVKDPAVHFILSWPEDEKPSDKQLHEAAQHALKKLRFQTDNGGHQYVIAVHRNTQNAHVHVAANRVHPVTWTPLHLEWSDKTLSTACREIEIEQGWRHEPGLAEVVEVEGEKCVITHKQMPRTKRGKEPISGPAKDMEAHTGETSFERYLIEVVATPSRNAIETGDWRQLHRVLDEHGVELIQRGGGLVFRDRERNIAAKASSVGHWAKGPRLEARLGAYQRPGERYPIRKRYEAGAPGGVRDLEQEAAAMRQAERDAAARVRSPGRQRYLDPEANEATKAQRSAEREALYQQYQDETRDKYRRFREAIKLRREDLRKRDQDRRAEAKTAQEQRRARLLAGRDQAAPALQLPPPALRTLLAIGRARDLERIQAERRRELAEIRQAAAQAPPRRTWREWLRERAGDDPRAARALRGLRYRERDAKPGDGLCAGPAAPLLQGWRTPEQLTEVAIDNAWRDEQRQWAVAVIERQERIGKPMGEPSGIMDGVSMYRREDQEIILRDQARDLDFALDRGRTILLLDISDASIEQTMRIAAAKWGSDIQLFGDDEFVARAAEMAARLGIQVGARDPNQAELVRHHTRRALGEASAAEADPHQPLWAWRASALEWVAREEAKPRPAAENRGGPPKPAKVPPEAIQIARRDADLVALARYQGWEIGQGDPKAWPPQYVALGQMNRRIILRGPDGDRWIDPDNGLQGDAIEWQSAAGYEFREAVAALADWVMDPAERARQLREPEAAWRQRALEREAAHPDGGADGQEEEESRVGDLERGPEM